MYQQRNKRLYERKAKFRKFEIGHLAYMYNPAMKPERCKKLHKLWTGPFKISRKLSDLNYEVTSMSNINFWST